MLDVAIVGGGPGGLAAAASILRAAPGLRVRVFEGRSLRPRGANVVVMPNGLRALEATDPTLAEELLGLDATEWQRGEGNPLYSKDGQLLRRLHSSQDERAAKHGPAPCVAWHQLQALLAEALPPRGLEQDVFVTRYEEGAQGVTLHFGDGRPPATARLLVGADGGQSRVRQQLLQDGPPVYMGTAIWRAVTPKPDWWPAQERSCFFGQPPHIFLTFALPGGTLAWQAYCPWPEERLGEIGGRRREYVQDDLAEEQEALERLGRVLGAYEGWADCVLRLIRTTDPRTITEHAQFYREQPTCTVWVKGRVALLGDAAHLATPMFAQGTSQAIEDALELGRAIRELGLTPEALQRYQAVRQPANAVVQASSVELFKAFNSPGKSTQSVMKDELQVAEDRGFLQKRFEPLVGPSEPDAPSSEPTPAGAAPPV